MANLRFFKWILLLLSIIGLLAFLVGLFRYSFVAPVSFDGAMNLNTAVSLAKGHGYGLFYDTFFPFPAQTDGPFIMPSALVVSMLGVSPFSTQFVNILYIIFLLGVLIVLFSRLGLPLWLALFAALVSASTPGFVEFGMNGYGEIPMLAWYFSGLLLLGVGVRFPSRYSTVLLSGVLFALSYLTKVVALIAVMPVFFVILLMFHKNQLAIKHLILFSCGFVMSIFCWEVFRFFSIGGLSAFVEWWQLQLGQVLYQSGVSGSSAISLAKVFKHFNELGTITSLNAYLLFVFLFSPVVIVLLNNTRESAEDFFYIRSLLLSGLLYFVWWLVVTPTSMMWLRRIIDGIIIFQVLIAVLVYRTTYSIFKGKLVHSNQYIRICMIVFLICLLTSSMMLTKKGQFVAKSLVAPKDSSQFIELAELIKKLPGDAKIFGTGWWQSPGLALYSGRAIYNFQRWTPDEINRLENKYFAFDRYAVGLDAKQIQSVLDLTETEKIYESEGGRLYKIIHARRYAPLDVSSSDLPMLRSYMDFSEGDYKYKSGFYQIEQGNQAWMRPDSLVVLKRNAEKKVLVSVIVPKLLVSEHLAKLQVEIEGCGKKEFELHKAEAKEVGFELECPPNRADEAVYIYMHVDAHMPGIRQIDADNRMLALRVRSVRLTPN